MRLLLGRFLLLSMLAALGACSGGGSATLDPYCTRYIGGSAVIVGLTPTALISPAPLTFGVPTTIGTVRISTSVDVFQTSPFELALTLQPASGAPIVRTITVSKAAPDFIYAFAIPPLDPQTQYNVFVQDFGRCPRRTPTTSLGSFITQ